MVKNPSANAGDISNVGWIPGLGNPLEEGIATHSSILAWRFLWTEESGGLQSTGLQRVRHDLVTKQQYKIALKFVTSINELKKNHPERDILSSSPSFLFVCLPFGLPPSIVVSDR